MDENIHSRSIMSLAKLSGRAKRSKTRNDVLRALNEALEAASPSSILRKKLKLVGKRLIVDSTKLDLDNYDRLVVIGGGKAAASMADELENLLGRRISAGVVNIPDYLEVPRRERRIEFHRATHPVPSEKGVKGVEAMLSLVGKPQSKDLIICLITGGGSALMPMPIKGLELSDEKTATNLLLRSGAPIEEINCVRKHLSAIKGGRLAEKLHPARVLTLIISDVVGDKLDEVASGPTVPDPTTYRDVMRILKDYEIWKRLPNRVRVVVEEAKKDTPKPGSRIFARVSNILVGTNEQSCLAAMSSLKRAGYDARVLSTHVQGEAREIGKLYAAVLQDMKASSAIIAGGETTVTITERAGKGGRNQELVLSASLGIDRLGGAVIASMGTDGVDGPTDAAGALADSNTIQRAKKKRLDARTLLRTHSSYNFFNELGDLIITGPTGTNVNDITILARSSRNVS
jgi:glycerate 2-kinase